MRPQNVSSEALCEAAPLEGEVTSFGASLAKKNRVRPAVHKRSTGLPQFFHIGLRPAPSARFLSFRMRDNRQAMSAHARVAGVLCWAFITVAVATAEQSDATFRVFLRTGDGVPSYGEPVEVGGRVIFTLVMGEPADRARLQLVDLPATAVDLDRTRRYANAVRAEYYARNHGEFEYQAVTAELARTLDYLPALDDPQLRLALAEQARANLTRWAWRSYGYRAADVRVLFDLFDGLIAELRAAVGGSQFVFDLTAGPVLHEVEPLLSAPGLRESIRLALAVATAADDGPSRLAILHALSTAVPDGGGFEAVRRDVDRRLGLEAVADEAYATLAEDFLGRATAFLAVGDGEAIEALAVELTTRDAALGAARPRALARLRVDLGSVHDRAVAYRAALDHYAVVRAERLAFERRVRPVLTALDGLTPILEAIRTESGPRYARLLGVEARVAELAVALSRTDPPEGLRAVHATLAGAVELVRQASARRRLSIVTDRAALSREASAAAAGALLLSRTARETLVALLFPPVLDER
jgi:hypothetical protein